MTIWSSLDHKWNVHDGIVSGIRTLFSLDHKIHLSYFNSFALKFICVSFAITLLYFKGPVVQREERQVENFTYINVQRYLEQNKLDIDSHSTTTETSDSGMSESHGAPTELGKGETNGKTHLIIKPMIRP